MDRDTFRCSLCGGVFELDPSWSEADALAEAEELFADVGGAGEEGAREVVCDDCHEAILAWWASSSSGAES